MELAFSLPNSSLKPYNKGERGYYMLGQIRGLRKGRIVVYNTTTRLVALALDVCVKLCTTKLVVPPPLATPLTTLSYELGSSPCRAVKTEILPRR